MKIILLTGFLIAAFGSKNICGQAIDFEIERDMVLHLTGENQYKERVMFEPPEDKPLILFFLPKPDSRSEAELLMDHVTRFFESLNEFKSESIKGVLVVEPVRTGPLVDRVFRSRLNNKSFPVLQDSDGEITGLVHDKPYSIMAWLVNGNGKILFRTTEPFSDSGKQRLSENIEAL